jgi:F-type H+-transporting ATPase subunit epsilon
MEKHMPLHFELVSPEKLLSSGPVYMVVAPGSEGDFGVLEGHAPFMSTIRPGVIAVYATEGASPSRIFIDGGFAEVNEKGLTILAEQATPVGDMSSEDISRQIANAREDAKQARTDAERDKAEKAVNRFEAMQSALTS